jgi:hypothetical protein
MFVPDYLKANAYRILGASAKATGSEIQKVSAALRRTAKLGLAPKSDDAVKTLGEISRSEADIQGALARIKNPSQRLTDRLFWFHVTSKQLDAPTASKLLQTFQNDPEATVALRHDQSLHKLLSAINSPLDAAGLELWVDALQAWNKVITDDNYWSLIISLEERGDFEPAALPSEIDSLRERAVELAAEALLVGARNAFARNEWKTVRGILATLEKLSNTGTWTTRALEEIVAPATETFQNLCSAVSQQCTEQTVRDPEAAYLNKKHCQDALERFRFQIQPALDRLLELVPLEHYLARHAKEEAARCLNTIAVNLTWADDFTGSEKLHEEALKLAGDAPSAIEIEDGLAQVKKSANRQRVLGNLKPISAAPSLYTFNTFGFTIYGRSDYDEESRSYVVTHYFVALFIPIFPIARYRVIAHPGNKYSFMGKLPLRTFDRWHLWIAILGITAFGIGATINSNNSPGSLSAANRHNYNPPATTYTPSAPTSSRSSQLSNLKAQIESGRAQQAALTNKLQPVMNELQALDNRMESLKRTLSTLDEKRKLNLPIDIGNYNSQVEGYNQALRRYQALFASNKVDIDTVIDLEKQDSRLVDQYNALLKR